MSKKIASFISMPSISMFSISSHSNRSLIPKITHSEATFVGGADVFGADDCAGRILLPVRWDGTAFEDAPCTLPVVAAAFVENEGV